MVKWKLKAAIQRTCARMPASETIYYAIQRRFGSLRRPPDPWPNLQGLREILMQLREIGFALPGKRVMEVGTGQRLDMPLGLYLCGAARVDTFDLHRYLRKELVLASVAAIIAERQRAIDLFAALAAPQDVERRLDILGRARTLDELRRAAGIRYYAPADAAHTTLPPRSVDLQFSYNVFEHIPRETLAAILRESNRVLADEGVACHSIDPSDHFAHDDPSISFINFLRFNEEEWKRYHDNQFAWHNRMRKDDYDRLYAEVSHRVIRAEGSVNQRSLELLRNGFPLGQAFLGRDPEMLATTDYRVFSRPQTPEAG
jgi:Methyltransferase domain